MIEATCPRPPAKTSSAPSSRQPSRNSPRTSGLKPTPREMGAVMKLAQQQILAAALRADGRLLSELVKAEVRASSCRAAHYNRAMLRKTRLFTPGPTPLLPAAQNAIAAADMHHRTAEFREIFTRTLADLKIFFGTQNDVLILAASGSGAMEASVSNLTSPGDKVVVSPPASSASAGAISPRPTAARSNWSALPTARPSTCEK